MRSSAWHAGTAVGTSCWRSIALCIYPITQFFVCCWCLPVVSAGATQRPSLTVDAIMMIINLFEVAVRPTCCSSSVLRRFFAGGPAAGHTDTQFMQVCCGRSCPSRYNWRTVYGMRLRLRTIGLHYRRGRVDETDHRLLIDYYKTNIDYEKN